MSELTKVGDNRGVTKKTNLENEIRSSWLGIRFSDRKLDEVTLAKIEGLLGEKE